MINILKLLVVGWANRLLFLLLLQWGVILDLTDLSLSGLTISITD